MLLPMKPINSLNQTSVFVFFISLQFHNVESNKGYYRLDRQFDNSANKNGIIIKTASQIIMYKTCSQLVLQAEAFYLELVTSIIRP